MNDPLQINLGDRSRNEVVIDSRSGRVIPVRAYGKPDSSGNEPDDLATLVQYLRILWKHKWVLVLAVTLGAIASLGYVLRITPLYTAKTTVEIQKPVEPLGKPAVEQNSTQTQIQLLLSSASKRRAVAKLLDGTVKIQDTQILGPLATVRGWLRMKDPAKTTSWEDSVASASAWLTVLPVKDSDILVIQTSSPNPQAAAEFVNSVAETFKQSIQEERGESFESTGAFLTTAQQRLKSKIEADQLDLAQFAKAHGLMFSTGQSGAPNPLEEKFRRIQSALIDARNQLISKEATTEAVASSPNPNESLPAVLDSGPMGSYQAQLNTLIQKREMYLVRLTPENDQVKEVQAQINEVEKALNSERTNVVSRHKIDNNAAKNQVDKLEADFKAATQALSDQSGDLITYNIKESNISSEQKLYDSMLSEAQQSSIESALQTSGARVVDPAGISPFPAQPDLMGYLTLGMLGGLCCGAGLVILRSRADLTIQVPGVMEAELNIRELGVIPSSQTDRTARKLRRYSHAMLPASANGTPRRLDTADCLEMVTRSEKPSVMAEAFRSTMTSILYSDENGERPKVLVFTSASPGEGKSTVISNLAIALAQIHQRVLLIDADMRLPRAHEIFDVSNSFGLSDVLHDQKPVEEYVEESLVKKTHIPYLYLLPAGPARAHLSRLFHSMRMQDLLLRFRDTFDVVLIDTAPVLVVPDSRILARSADAVVLVIRAHQTHQEAAFAAASRFSSDGTRILGTILNDWNPDKATQGYGGYYGNNGYYSGSQ